MFTFQNSQGRLQCNGKTYWRSVFKSFIMLTFFTFSESIESKYDEDSEEDILLDRIMVLENRLSRMRDDDGDETANKRRKILEKTLCRAYDKLDKCQENKED